MPAATSSTCRSGGDVDGLAERLADDLQRGADHGVVAGGPRRLLLRLDGFEVDGRVVVCVLIGVAPVRRWRPGVGRESFDGRGAGGGSTAAAKVVPSRKRRRAPDGRRRRPRRRARRAGRRAGRWRWRGPSRGRGRRARRSGRSLAGHLAERGGDGPVERAGCAHGGAEVLERRADGAEHVAQVGLGRRLAAVGGGEHRRPADHVLEHAAHGELGARRRPVELVGRDAGDDAAEQRAELVELGQGIHGSSVSLVRPDGAARARGGGLAVAAELDELGHVVRSVLVGHGCDHPGTPPPASGMRPISPGAPDAAAWDERPIAARRPARGWWRGRCRTGSSGRTISGAGRDRPGAGTEEMRDARCSRRDGRRARGGRHRHEGEDWGGQLVRHLRPAAGRRLHARCSQGLPGDMCQCPHWGYVIAGSITVRYADGTEEISRAGDLYYWPGGHTGWTDDGVTFVEFSPAEELRPVLEHVGAQLAPHRPDAARRATRRWLGSRPCSARRPRSEGERARARRAGADPRRAGRGTTGRPPSTPPARSTFDDAGGRGRAGRPAGRGRVVARPARRLHRGARARLPRPTTSSATSAGPGSARCGCTSTTASWPDRPSPAGGCGGPGAPSTATPSASSTAPCCCARPRPRTAAATSTGPSTLATPVIDLGRRAAVRRPRGRGAPDHRPRADRPGRGRRGHGPPRRGDALRGRGPPRPVLDRQGVLQPHQRLRGARRPRPGRRVDRGHDALGAAPPVRDLPGHLPGAPGGRAQAARRSLAEAEREAARACEELVGSHLVNSAAAYAEVGDIRRRLGELDRAEEAFARAQELCGRPCGGLALLRLAQGRVDAAMAIISGCLRDTGTNRLARASVLPMFVHVAIAAGDLDAAGERARRARRDRRRVRHADPAGHGALDPGPARARAGRRARPPAPRCTRPLERWQALDVPYEVATARTLLGQALREIGDDGAAAASFAAAASAVRPDRRPARRPARVRRRQADAPGRAHRREVEVLRLVAAGLTNNEIAGRALPQRQDRLAPPVEHLHQDRRLVPRRGHRLRLRARPRRLTASKLARSRVLWTPQRAKTDGLGSERAVLEEVHRILHAQHAEVAAAAAEAVVHGVAEDLLGLAGQGGGQLGRDREVVVLLGAQPAEAVAEVGAPAGDVGACSRRRRGCTPPV